MLVDNHQPVRCFRHNIGFRHLSAGDTERIAAGLRHRLRRFLCPAHQRRQLLMSVDARKHAAIIVNSGRRIGLLRNIRPARCRPKDTGLRIGRDRFALPSAQRRFGRTLHRPKPALVQRLAQTADDHAANHRRLAETHFGLGRMDIHINQFGRHVDEQRNHRMPVPRQHLRIGTAHGTDQQPVLHRAAIDEQKLVIGHAAIIGRQARHAGQENLFPLQVDPDAVGAQVAAGQRGHPLRPGFPGLHRDRLASLMLQCEADIGPCHCQTADNVGAGGIFAARGAQELAPCRHLGEQLLHPDLGPRRNCRRSFLHQFAVIDHPRPAILPGHPAFDGQARDAGDRRQRFPAKTHGRHQLDRLVRQLRRGMAFQRQGNVVAAHAGAVVGDLNEIEPALFQADIDLAGSGVDRIFDQLLESACRAFDDLAGSDPIYQAVWKSSY